MAAVWSAADWAEKGPEASAEAGPVAGATEEDTGKAEEGPEASAKAGPVAEATEEDAGKAGQEAAEESEVQADAGAEMAAAAEAAAKAGAWTEAAAEAEAAYELHDSYSIEHKRALQRHTARASELLDALQPASLRERTTLAFLRGKVLDASPAYSAEAEALLTRTVKLDPKNVDAWNVLGECLWKGGQLELSRACFREALKVRTNADSLCQLSMLLRSMSSSSSGANPALLESLRLAKDAVTLGPDCGRSWGVLGNAYLSNYFGTYPHRLEDLHLALKAYRRAASSPHRAQFDCADLWYNQGIVLHYLLDYAGACEAFERAHELGPELNAAAQRRVLLAFGRKCAAAIEARGHLPRKRLQQLEKVLRAHPLAAAEARAVTVAELAPGANAGASLSASVVAELLPAAQTPLCYVLVDSTGESILLAVYGILPSAVGVYQVVTVLGPERRTVCLPGDGATPGLSYDVLVVEEPTSQMLVQGKPLAAAQVGRARVTSTATAYLNQNNALRS